MGAHEMNDLEQQIERAHAELAAAGWGTVFVTYRHTIYRDLPRIDEQSTKYGFTVSVFLREKLIHQIDTHTLDNIVDQLPTKPAGAV